MNTLEMKI